MPDIIPPHSRGGLLEELSELATKRNFKGDHEPELNALDEQLDPNLLLRVRIMMREPIDVLKQTLEEGADPNYTVKGVSTYDLAQAFGDDKTIGLLKQYCVQSSTKPKKSHF